MSKTTKTIIGVIIAIVAIGGIWYGVSRKPAPIVSTSTTAKEPIKIGILTHQTGFGAIWGESEAKAAVMALEEIKRKGCNLSYFTEDCASDVVKCTNAANKLINIDKVQFIIGPTWDEWFEPVAKMAEQSHVILISPSGKSGSDIGPYTFSLKYTNEGMADAILDFLNKNNAKNIFLVTTQNQFFGSISNAVKNFNNNKYHLKITEEKVPPQTNDFKTLLLKIKDKNPDWVLVNVVQTNVLNFIKQAKEFGLNKIVYSSNIAVTPENEDVLKDVYHIDFKINPDFILKYKNRYNSEPGPSAQLAYDTAYLIFKATEGCKILDKEEIIQNLDNIKYHGVTGLIKFDKKGYAKWGKEVYFINKY